MSGDEVRKSSPSQIITIDQDDYNSNGYISSKSEGFDEDGTGSDEGLKKSTAAENLDAQRK